MHPCVLPRDEARLVVGPESLALRHGNCGACQAVDQAVGQAVEQVVEQAVRVAGVALAYRRAVGVASPEHHMCATYVQPVQGQHPLTNLTALYMPTE